MQGHRHHARGAGRSPARAGGRRRTEHSGEHIVVATGSDPVIPPIDGPARARGRLDQPRGHGDDGGAASACWCWAAGPVGAEMAQACARMGVVGDARGGHGPPASARARAARRRARRGARRRGHRAAASASTPRPPAGTATIRARVPRRQRAARRPAARGHRPPPTGGRASASRTSASRRASTASRSTGA